MSKADEYFKAEVNDILKNGFSDDNFEVRPTWKDGTPAHTKKLFAVVRKYDLEKEFPILTLRKQYFKSAVREILWLFRDKSNNINDLNAHIWDSWADKKGSIGKSYGYQLAKKYKFPEGKMDQVQRLIYNLKNNPMNRRMIVTMWNNADEKDMHLAPCCYETIWDVSNGRLNCTLIQRSGDLLAAAGAGGFNDIEYAVLVHMIAQCVGLKPGIFVHYLNNLHIYDRHEKIVKELLKKDSFDSPILVLNKDKHNIEDFTEDDFKLINYKYNKFDEKIEVAI